MASEHWVAHSVAQRAARWRLWLILSVALMMPLGVVRADSVAGANRFAEAAQYYQQGAFDRAIVLWRQVSTDTIRNNEHLRLRAYLGVAAACHKLGLYQEAFQALSEAHVLLGKIKDANVSAQYYQQLGNLHLANHQHAQSLDAFNEALAQSTGKADTAVSEIQRALVLNDYGNALAVSGYATDALAAYEKSLGIAQARNLTPLALSAGINLVRLKIEQDDLEGARQLSTNAALLLNGMPRSGEWAMSILTMIELDRLLAPAASDVEQRKHLDWLAQVQAFALETANARLLSLTYGYHGGEALRSGATTQAVELTNKAIFHASQAQAPDILYRWYWQLALLLRQQGNLDAALETFDRALTVLAPIRKELLNGYHDSHVFFQQKIRPVYLDFADALLVRADNLSGSASQRTVYDRARNIIEALKSAELQDYFRDECVVAQESRAMTLEQVAPSSALLYPIVLANRVELLLYVNGEYQKRSVAVNQAELVESALRLREFIQDPTNTRFLPYANRLYRWLIEPVKQQLVAAGVDTLIVIPDGALRTIPFAALHSGERYLVEEFAMATTPSLKLTASSRASAAQATVLLGGVAQSVQGFSPLPEVATELATIQSHVGGKVLSDRQYTKGNLTTALMTEDYSIVHMATHGTVGATPAESFLLTYDSKLTMSDLEYLLRIGQFRKNPVELLTLSACETAVGDERAALGLAGIAVKSGAQSVVASLWLVDDNATASLMNRFYRNLSLRDAAAAASKAKALRSAQLGLLADPATQHPANWAAFMLIGNWL
jgi:CHAT domain-containing protein